MNTIGVIGAQIMEGDTFMAELNENRQDLIKIYAENKKVFIDKEQFPHIELVENIEDIIKDNKIDTVFVSKQKMDHISAALQAGKSVRAI